MKTPPILPLFSFNHAYDSCKDIGENKMVGYHSGSSKIWGLDLVSTGISIVSINDLSLSRKQLTMISKILDHFFKFF